MDAWFVAPGQGALTCGGGGVHVPGIFIPGGRRALSLSLCRPLVGGLCAVGLDSGSVKPTVCVKTSFL